MIYFLSEDNILHNQNKKIQIERFMNKKNIVKDSCIVLSFIAIYMIVGLFENNFFLPNNGLGLLEHINIWIFLGANLLMPIAIYGAFKILMIRVDSDTLEKLKITFKGTTELRITKILLNFSTTVGFCCFIGNSLQNAKIINPLPFDYWDSIDYIISYFVSRCHKFYLFVYFIPLVLSYIFVLIKAISELLVINENEMGDYPIKNYEKLNILCNFGLNVLLILVFPFMLFSFGVCFIHGRFDITSNTTIIISSVSTFICFGMYLLLIKRFYTSITTYKRKNIEQIDLQLSEIYQYILNIQHGEDGLEKLEIYIKKEEYLMQTKEELEKISKFPHIIKAIFTSISPVLPALLQNMFQLINAFFKSDILDNIL